MSLLRRILARTDFWRQTRLEPLSASLLLIWILSMVSLPIVRWIWGDSVMRTGINAGVLAQIALVLVILRDGWGWKRTVRVTLLVTACAWIAEAVGSHTGFPFGAYDYTARLQPQLLGVPLLIPLAWMMMLPPSWAMAQLITGGAPGRRGWFVFCLVSAFAMTAWDLFLDPQMVAWRFWTWQQPGGYFGIPWVNFLGWLLVSGTVTALVRPTQLPLPGLVAVYGITWLLESIGQLFFWDLPGPAMAGFAGMGFVLWISWQLVKQRVA